MKVSDHQLDEIVKAAYDAFFLQDSGREPCNAEYLSTPNQRYVRAVHPDLVMAMIAELRELRKLKANLGEILK